MRRSSSPRGEPFSTEIRKVKDGLCVIPGYDGFPPSSGKIVGKVRSATSQPIKYVLSTHGHGDHSGGHPEFITIAEILAHWNNRATLDGVLKLDFDAAIPGHGPVLTKDDVRTFRQKLVTLRQPVVEVVKSAEKKQDLATRLKTDDLGCRASLSKLVQAMTIDNCRESHASHHARGAAGSDTD